MKKNKALLIGYGNMGKDWGKIILKRKDIEVVSVIDVLDKNKQQAHIDFSIPTSSVFSSLSKALLLITPDVIIDSSPPFIHPKNSRIALNSHIPILGEKPISLSLKEAEKIVNLSKKNKVLYMVNQNYRRNPVISIVKKTLKSLGNIESIEIDYHQLLNFNDTFRSRFSHPLLIDMAIHHFDLVRYITNSNAEEVFTIEQNPVSSKFINGATAYTTFKMEKRIIFSYRGSWSANRPNSSFNGQWHIICDKGCLYWDGDNEIKIEANSKSKTIRIPKKQKMTPYELFLYELSANLDLFLKSISNKTLPDCWCGDNLNSLKMIISASKSSDKNTKVRIR